MSKPDALAISQAMKDMVNQQDVDAIIKTQKGTLQRMEKSNAMLTNCNNLSQQQLAIANEKFSKHTATLIEMRKDLQSIYTRIRLLKNRLMVKYPGEFAMALEEEMQNVSVQNRDGDGNNVASEDDRLYESSAKSHFSHNNEE